MNEPETETDDPQIEVEAVDVDEIVRQERVRAIFDARRRCREIRSDAKIEKYEGNRRAGRAVYRDAVETYIREVQTILEQTEQGRRIWAKQQFGTMDITPTVEDVPGNTDKIRLKDGTVIDEAPDGREVVIRGLKSLFELSPPFTARFEVVVPRVGRKRHTKTKKIQVNREIPLQILDEMFAAVNQYLADVGFDVEVGKTEQHTKLDDDLLSEVEQWRRENL